MILHGQKKRVLKDVIRYYVDTTGNAYEDFILSVQKTRGDINLATEYPDWLALKSFELLGQYDITLADCIENKDTIRAAIKEEESRQGGEFYTPEVWCVEGRKYLKEMLGDLWGKAYIWDASCGSGNLLRSSDYPRDKIFMSSILPEDIELVKNTPEFEGATVFQLDFVNDIDWDENNKFFSEKLPPKLIEVLENNEPLVFYMNPPYKVMEANSSDVGAYMASHGMAKCALDIFHQFMYRMCMIKRFYQLTNVYLGIFGPVTMFHSTMLEPLYEDFKRDFVFQGGMCFDAGDFSNTSESVGWLIGYTTWRSKTPEDKDRTVVLEAKMVDENQNVIQNGHRVFKVITETLHKWVEPKDVIKYGQLPQISMFKNFTGRLDRSVDEALGYMMSASRVIDASRRASVASLPLIGSIPITQENFWRCVASYSARRTYTNYKTPFNNSQYFSKPDLETEGFNQWVADALVLFLFDYDQQAASYRNLELDGTTWNISNRLFPISADVVRSVVTDEVILEDLNNHPPQNQFLVSVLEAMKGQFGPEAQALYEFGMTFLLNSLYGDKRKQFKYDMWTSAWDAGLIQMRHIEGFLSKAEQEEYEYKVSRLKHHLLDGVYKYGFMMNSEDSYDEGDLEEEESEEFEEESFN